jgi:hypothetical protein
VFRGAKRDAAKALDKLVAETGPDRKVGTTATVGKLLTDWLASLERLQGPVHDLDVWTPRREASAARARFDPA